MSTSVFVVLLVVLVGVLAVLLALRERERRGSDDDVRVAARPTGPPPAPVSPELVVGPTVSDIAIGVFLGLWLFVITAGGLALFAVAVAASAVRNR